MQRNVVGWFEIPVNDMERAIQFYQDVFRFEFDRHKLDNLDMAWFPMLDEKMGSPGTLIYNPEFYKPSQDGVLVYFTSPSGDCENELKKVESAGGKVIIEKRMISEQHGYMGALIDSEGNRIAIHSRK